MDTAHIPTPPAIPRPPDAIDRVYCLHAFHAENADELSFDAGGWVDVLEKDDEFGDGWWKGRRVGEATGEGGLFPASYVLAEGVDPGPWREMLAATGVHGTPSKTQETQPMASAASAPKSPSRPASIRSRSRASSPELEIPPLPTPTLGQPQDSTKNDVEKEKTTGLELSIPPVTDAEPVPVADSGVPEGKTSEPHPEDEHTLGRRDEAIVGPAERAAEAAVHPDIVGKHQEASQAVQEIPEKASSDKISFKNTSTAAADGNMDIDSSDDEQEQNAASTRSRLAEAARAENTRQEAQEAESGSPRVLNFGMSSVPGSNAHSRTGSVQMASTGVRMANGRPTWSSGSGLPAGLIYSDESDSEGSSDEDGEFGTAAGSRKTSGGAPGSITKSPKMSRDERDRRVFGDDFDSRGLMERVKGVAGVSGGVTAGTAAAGLAGNGLVGMNQTPKQTELQSTSSSQQPVAPVIPSPVEPLRVPGSISTPPSSSPIQKAAEMSPSNQNVAQERQVTPEPALSPPANIEASAPHDEAKPSATTAKISSTDVSANASATARSGLTLSPPMNIEESPMGTPAPAEFGTSPVMASNPDMGVHADEVDAGYAFPPIPAAAPAVALAPSPPITEPAPPVSVIAATPVAQHMLPQAQMPVARTPSPLHADHTQEASREIVTPTPPSTSVLSQTQFTTPNQGSAVETVTSSSNGWAAVPGDPSTWTVDQVVAWAKGKGFDDTVQSKLVEHEITGDVLLEMDANTLKEIDIVQFGKRVKIANAINELRRPGSMRSFGHGSSRSQQMSPAYNSHHRVPSITAAYPVSPNYGPDYQQSSQPPQHSRSASVSGIVDTIPEDEAYNPQQRETAALGFNESSTASPVQPATDYSEWSTSRKSSVNRNQAPIREEDESSQPAVVTLHTPEPPLSSTFTSGTSQPTTAVGSSTHQAESVHSKASSIPPTPTTPSTRRGSVDRPSSAFGHRKAKSSADGNGTIGRAPSDRVGGLLSGALSRNRKPAPRYPSSASAQNLDQLANDGNDRRSLRGFMGGHSKKDSRGSTPSTMTKASSANPQRISVGTPMPLSPNARSGLSNPETPSALSKIGTPDFAGFLKKKGDRYNSWKTRYFVLKGARLYYLRNEREQKLKGHIDLAGYKVVTDTNPSSGNYGFQLVHDREKAHHFSSNDHRVVKEWMKNLMKATITRDFSAPVVSSCNIHTIPLREAQALAPRPPSPSSMQATQRAARRDNPNQLTARDASVLMEFDKEKGKHMSIPVEPRGTAGGLGYGAPPRPSREMRRPSGVDKARNASLASYYPDEEAAPVDIAAAVPVPTIPEQYLPSAQGARPAGEATAPVLQQTSGTTNAALLQWVNANLPPGAEKATSIPGSFISGKLICRVIEHIVGPDSVTASQTVSDSQFEPVQGEPNLEGIFSAFDKCIDENVDINGISINDMRSGDAERITTLLENLRKWGEQRRLAA